LRDVLTIDVIAISLAFWALLLGVAVQRGGPDGGL